MIHEEICTYEVAKLAKEKGFPQDDWSCFGDMNHSNGVFYSDKEKEPCIAPTLSLLEYWLSMVDDFRIHLWQYNNDKYVWQIDSHRGYGYGGFRGFNSPVYFSSYELALEDALQFALNLM